MHVIERRFAPSQLRAVQPTHFSNSPGTLVSYAATYNVLSSDVGGFKERCAPGCFDRSIRNGDDVVQLINHSPDLVCGRRKAGTLRISSDQKGLRSECDLPDTTYARDLMVSVQRGDIAECSFAFIVDDDEWANEQDLDNRGQSIPVRTLKSVRLADCSYVTSPAYPNTSIKPMEPGIEPLRSHSFNELFPNGVPAEVRSRVGDVRALLERSSERRRRIANRILSI